MSVIVSLGIEVFNEKIAHFGDVRAEYQEKKMARPKRAFPLEKQESFLTWFYYTLIQAKLCFIQVLKCAQVYEIAVQDHKIAEANVFINKEGVKDEKLANQIKKTIRHNQEAVQKFLMSEDIVLHLEFQQKRNTRKRSGNVWLHL